MKGATQHSRRLGKITARQQRAYPSARYPLVIQGEGACMLDAEPRLTEPLAHFGQQIEIAAAIATETEVVTHDQMTHSEAPNQHPLDKLDCRETTQVLIERQAEHIIEIGRASCREKMKN